MIRVNADFDLESVDKNGDVLVYLESNGELDSDPWPLELYTPGITDSVYIPGRKAVLPKWWTF